MPSTTVACSMSLAEFDRLVDYKSRIGHTGSLSDLIKQLLKAAMELDNVSSKRSQSCRK